MKIAVIAILAGSLLKSQQFPPERWVQAERDVRRLKPEAFPQVPKRIVRYLRRHGYTVPQTFGESAPATPVGILEVESQLLKLSSTLVLLDHKWVKHLEGCVRRFDCWDCTEASVPLFVYFVGKLDLK